MLTGGTGFLGTALVEKILRSLPDLGRLYLVVRPSRGKSAAERFEKDVLGAVAFRGLRENLGDDFEEHVSKKVRVLEGDVHAPSLGLGEEDLAELSREVDLVIHSAASVVFDAPLDAALDSNVRGTLGLLKLARAWEKRPLFMHISTAYVSGTSKEDAQETPPGPSSPDGTALDAREEVLGLEAVVAEVEEASQERSLLRRFETEAQRELGMVGEKDEVAERVDQLRRAWMRERLVERGTQRAQELGWNDVYTFTKSLAERMVVAERGDSPLVILRPAIIESSHREPYPGWIQGTRMADPIIMAFAKGILREFPGNPKSYVDIVPVDHVVNAILAAGVRRAGETEVFQVASGDRNPIRYRDLYDIVRDYFVENPLRDSSGRPIQVPEWSFPGRRRVEGRLKLELAGLKVAGMLAARMPEGHMATDARQRIARAEKRARMSLYYSRIYGAYANMTSTFASSRTEALYTALPPEDREEFPFDITDIDWRTWMQGAHEDDRREAWRGRGDLRRGRHPRRLQRGLLLRVAQDEGASCGLASPLARRVPDQGPLLLGTGQAQPRPLQPRLLQELRGLEALPRQAPRPGELRRLYPGPHLPRSVEAAQRPQGRWPPRRPALRRA